VKLGKLWTNPWPWSRSLGVGLKLVGCPSDEQMFLQFLYAESCNPVAAHRILKELKEKAVKLTTVQASFDFERLEVEFERLGVSMMIVPPVETPNNTVIDSLALELCVGKTVKTDSLSTEDVEEAYRRAANTGELNPSTLGPYAWVGKQV
jgi:hypothetical protein